MANLKKEEMKVDESDGINDSSANASNTSISFLSINHMDLILSNFKMKSVHRPDIEQYIELFNTQHSKELKLSKTISCIGSKPKTSAFRLSIYVQNVFVMEIKCQITANKESCVDNMNILEWNEYPLKRKQVANNQCLIEPSSHRLFQKLTIQSQIFYKQFYKKVNKKSATINPNIISLHRLMIWLSEYKDLYTKPCDGCNQMLSIDSDRYGLLLPTLRIKERDTVCAFHAACVHSK
eukprot:29845_1